MENLRAIEEILNQTKKIEENNWNTTQYLNSIDMLLASNDLARSQDEELSSQFSRLHDKVEDINQLTEQLISHLSSKHN
ncbi:MAG: hypothetical protein GX329_00755 [Tissierellia bacterium]|nr:hypothetical protein [Tissierellia bacterium]